MSSDLLFTDDLAAAPPRALSPMATAWQRLAFGQDRVAQQVRGMLQEWWAAMPEATRAQVKRELQQETLGQHLGAFWELYLHQMLKGLEVTFEPAIGTEDGRGDRPDFLVTGAGFSYWIEATVVLGEDAVRQDERARVEQLYAAIQRATNRDFLVAIALKHVGPSTPGKRLVRELDRWLGTLDADAELERLTDPEEARAEKVISRDGWVFKVKASPKRRDLRGRADLGVIGEKLEGWQVHRVEGERVVEFEGFKRFDETSFLAKGLREKARHGYDVRDRPFVIAVLCGGLFADDRALAQALLGRIRYSVGSGDGSWTGHGLWLDDKCRPQNTHVSAVLAISDLRPSSCAIAEPRLWTNPWARVPLPPDAMPWRRFDIRQDGSIDESEPSASAAEVLDLGPHSHT
jgi:hypothetical protein